MGDDTKPGMREFFFENLREDARRDGIEKCPQTRDAKTFQWRAPSSAKKRNYRIVKQNVVYGCQ